MSRIPRWRLGRGVYHVINRANNRLAILSQDADKAQFRALRVQYGAVRPLTVYHYAIMSHHFHLAVAALDLADVRDVVGQVTRQYARGWHRTYGGTGYLWQGRFRRHLVQRAGYLERLGRDIERNPVAVAAPGVSVPWDYPWSSAAAYVLGAPDPLVTPAEHPVWPSMGLADPARRATYAAYLLNERERAEDQAWFGVAGPPVVGDAEFGRRYALHAGRPRPRAGMPHNLDEAH